VGVVVEVLVEAGVGVFVVEVVVKVLVVVEK